MQFPPGPPTLMPPACRSFLNWLCLLTFAGSAAAFGPDGHRIVGELAERQLTPDARAQVRRLLASEAEPTLAAIANWADEVRSDEVWRWTAPLHYVNFPRDGGCRYQARRDCRNQRCVVAAIQRYARVLGARRGSVDERAQALRFLVHFVGDIHQPLHAGYGDDRGGNTFQIFYAGRGSNLHALWDGGILRSARRDWQAHAEVLAQRRTVAEHTWSRDAAQHWAEESCRLIDRAEIYPASPGRLPAGYVERQLPVVERQLVVAGARLAALLNALLARSP